MADFRLQKNTVLQHRMDQFVHASAWNRQEKTLNKPVFFDFWSSIFGFATRLFFNVSCREAGGGADFGAVWVTVFDFFVGQKLMFAVSLYFAEA